MGEVFKYPTWLVNISQLLITLRLFIHEQYKQIKIQEQSWCRYNYATHNYRRRFGVV